MLSEPWRTWLSDTQLLEPTNQTTVLFTPPQMDGMIDDFGLCSRAFGVAKSIYPDLSSLIISSDAIYQLVVDGMLVLSDAKKVST